MDPDLLPSLVSYYQQSQCTKEIGYKIEVRKQTRIAQKLESKVARTLAEQEDLRTQIEELKLSLSNALTTADVRQREIETLRVRHQGVDKADKAHAQSLKVQADSYKREIGELRDDLKLRDEELTDLRQDALERDKDLKDARDLTRTRDKEMKETRDHLRARESEVRKANHWIEKLQASVQRLELEVTEGQDALEASKEALAESEERFDTLQAQRQIAMAEPPRPAMKPVTKAPKTIIAKTVLPKTTTIKAPSPVSPPQVEAMMDDSEGSEPPSPVPTKAKQKASVPKAPAAVISEPETDYNEPPSKVTKKAAIAKSPVKATTKSNPAKRPVKISTADKENQNVNKKTTKKRKAAEDFSASPPRSSPPPESPKRKQTKKPDFSMTPFVDKTQKNQLSLIPLSPPSSKPTAKERKDQSVVVKDHEPKPKKKRKLLGGTRTLMDDTPKKTVSKPAKTNFGKELSPLKRPVSSAGLVMKN